MSILSDRQIRERVERYRMIEPFEPMLVRTAVLSYGTAGYGYDLRLAPEFHRYVPRDGWDPKRPFEGSVETFSTDRFWVQPGETVLARSLEYFRIPRDVLGLVFGKSTYARCGLIVNVTPLEPEWEGHITMALINGGRFPVCLYAREGIAQVVFLQADDVCETSYADRRGKYQAQTTITPPRVE